MDGTAWSVHMLTTDGQEKIITSSAGEYFSPSQIESLQVTMKIGGGPFVLVMVDLDPPEPGNPIWAQVCATGS